MKKFAILLSLALLPMVAWAKDYDTYIDGIYYRFIDGHAEVTSKKTLTKLKDGVFDYVGNIKIPASVEYQGVKYMVTSIGEGAFLDNDRLQTVELPNTIKHIDCRAFARCDSLRSINIPEGITHIYDGTFSYCRKLKAISLPSSLICIGAHAFSHCGIEKITLPEGLQNVGESAFHFCWMDSIVIPASVQQIGKYAFAVTNGLSSVTINSDSVLSKTNRDLRLKDLFGHVSYYHIGEGVTTIGDHAFAGEYNMDNNYTCFFYLPRSLKRIGSYAFYHQNIGHLEIPYGVTSIGSGAFCGSTLFSIKIPNSVKELAGGVFSECKSLTYITLPNSLETIGTFCFKECAAMDSILLPQTITKIEYGAFEGCTKLKSITLPDGVAEIEGRAFYGCRNLATIHTSKSLQKIGSDAFKGCDKLLSITVPEGIASLHANALDSHTKVIRKKLESFPEQPFQADPSALPILNIIEGSFAFVDPSGTNVISSNSSYSVRFQLTNSGKGPARGCTVIVKGKGVTDGIHMSDMKLPTIGIGETRTVEVPLTTDMETQDGEVEFAIQVDEPNGFGTDPQYITVKTRAFEAPKVQVTDYSLTADGGATLKKKQPFDLQLMLQNTQRGVADDVQVTVEVPQNVLMIEGEADQRFPQLQGGETKSLIYSLIVNNNYAGTTIPIKVHLKERHGKYAEDRTINLTLDQSLASAKIKVDERQQESKDITIARLSADVDKDIPQIDDKQENTFAVIIANEQYQKVAAVPFALNDARVFVDYCRRTLGIPSSNIRQYENATFGTMLTAMADIKDIAAAYNGDVSIILYYAGHGFPNEQTHEAYLLPVDANGSQTEVCLPVGRLYKELGETGARSVVVFMDACFSGAKRGDGMLATARSVAIKPNTEMPQGNMVVFSAASGDETAYPYKEKGHGMFTYFLLKKLRDSMGTCTLGDLSEYIQTKVRQESIIINRKIQTPTVVTSASLAESWKTLKLR